ncbi:hypothetical protein GCM10022240_23040 [Microbacterium kribbense]|uniref:DNA mismatch repair protein n=1 Tax=Microbacterium kribbense TaxID=433645 RepID=A0ABP7GLM8_9MICO
MRTTRVTPAAGPPRLRPGTGLHLMPIGRDRWRVVDAAGLIVGHIGAEHEARGTRYRARRYHPGSRAFLDLGAFWSIDDAVDCLRYGR